jgi:putative transcription factor
VNLPEHTRFSRNILDRHSAIATLYVSTSIYNASTAPSRPKSYQQRARDYKRKEIQGNKSTEMPTGRLSGNITQDWEPVVLRRTKPKAADLKSSKAVNQALRSGAAVETVRKSAAGMNKHSTTVAPARKLDETTEPTAVERVAVEVRAAIQKARVAKGWSQAELAKRINERAQVVQDCRSTRAARRRRPRPCLPRWSALSRSSSAGRASARHWRPSGSDLM